MNGADLVSSADQGVTWTTVTSATLSSGSLIQLPDGRLASVIGAHVATSLDLGASWRQVGPTLPFAEDGIVYSVPRGTFYAWRSDCDFTRSNPVPETAILRWDAT